jgi:hypothetical protein
VTGPALSSRTVLVAALALTLASLPLPARAQGEGQGAPAETGEPRWETGVHLQGLFFDNFFQLPADEPQQDVEALRAEGRLSWRPRSEWPLEVYGVAGATSYLDEDLDESLLVGGGLRWDGLVDLIELDLRYEADRPSFEVGDTFGTAELLGVGGLYSHRIADSWELSALANHQRLDYAADDGRDSFFRSVGAAVRYRGWGYEFSPEVGVEVGERDADAADEDNDQTDLWLKLRSAPIRPLYLSLRYRHRVRDYSVDDPAASNFRREDDRDQIVLTADWRTSDLLTWTLYYAREDADSSKATRVFDTQLLAVGVRLTP